MLGIILVSAVLILLATASSLSSNCIQFPVSISATANNTVLPTVVDPTNPIGYFSNITGSEPTQKVSGTYDIFVQYCKPTANIGSRAKTLQLLVHGITADRTYWNGHPSYSGNRYSWVAHAAAQGFATLAIDRLGSGLSSHPDPLNVVQFAFHIETIHELIRKARAGILHSDVEAFDRVVYIGHSYGSWVGNAMAAKYPNDTDATILTGFSSLSNTHAFNGANSVGVFTVAAGWDPVRFGELELGYVLFSSIAGTAQITYAVPGRDYDPKEANLEYFTQSASSLGELITVRVPEASGYTNPVFIVTGSNDAVFCGQVVGYGFCGYGDQSIVRKTSELYPNTRSFDYFQPNRTGHALQYHYSANQTYAAVNSWFDREGF